MDGYVLIGHLQDVLTTNDPAVPLYRQLSGAIGELKLGDPLPGERILADELDLSRVTVRKAIKALEEGGLVRRRHGVRTEIASRVAKSFSFLATFSEDISSRGMRPGCIWVFKRISRPTPTEMMALGISNGQNVVRLKCIRTADEQPIAIETSAAPARFLPSPNFVDTSLHETLARLDAVPFRAVQRVSSRPATESDTWLLQREPGTPMLVTERHSFLADDQIVEFCETRYRGDVYDFAVELRR